MAENNLRYFEICSPEYSTYSYSEPPDYMVDWCLVAAKTKREAKIKAHRFFSSKEYIQRNFGRPYYKSCCAGNHPPYKCLMLTEITDDPTWIKHLDILKKEYYYVE